MKKALIIASFWPYRQGSRRTIGLAKYLPEFGWQPIILTPPLHGKPAPQFRVIETPYRGVLSFWKKLLRLNPDEDVRSRVKKRFGVTSKNSLMDHILTLVGEIANYPDLDKGWKPFAVNAGDKLLRNEHIDAMISVSPATRHLVAKDLKSKHKIPWIADFPDLWSQNHNYYYGSIRKWFDRRLELETVSQADALITVSQPWAEKLRALHKGKLVYSITHGFDTEEVNDPLAKVTAKFTITYTGSIYTGKQHPQRLFAALRDLIFDGTMNPKEIEVRFYGSEVVWLGKEIKQHGLSNIAKQYGKVPREIAWQKQRESQLLLLLDWDDSQEKGVYTGKIFEYFGARRPIIATGGSTGDVVGELLSETKAGRHAPTVEDIKSTLKELYQEYKLNGEVAYRGQESAVNKYSHREMARKFAGILNSLI